MPAVTSNAASGPNLATTTPAIAGPMTAVSEYMLVSTPLARSQSARGSMSGKSERAPVMLRMLLIPRTDTISKRIGGGNRWPSDRATIVAPSTAVTA